MDYVEVKNYDFSKHSADSFKLAEKDDRGFDKKFETKPIGYFKDALIRFTKNKGSVFAAIVLFLIIGFSLLGPLASQYSTTYGAEHYDYLLPKNPLFEGTGFWDGTEIVTKTDVEYYYDLYRGAVVKGTEQEIQTITNGKPATDFKYRFDSYVYGVKEERVTPEEYEEILAYQKANNVQILMPLLQDLESVYDFSIGMKLSNWYSSHGSIYYKINSKTFLPEFKTQNGQVVLDEEGYPVVQDIYLKDSSGNYKYFVDEGDIYKIRVDYDEYYYLTEGIKPMYLFGSDGMGRDLYTRICHGLRFSLILGFGVSLINIIIGVIYGAIEGYYGGTIDLVMERISDILVEIPSIVILTLFQINFADKVGIVPALLFAFVLTGWIGMASRVRMQFYRFKGQEYVLAARTLGAKDRRIIFRHILPNAIGTLITSCILMVPSVIFSESTLSFLNIIDLEQSSVTSLGTILSNGQVCLQNGYYHALIFPAVFISILMISFNLFGNGLRDAFNPSLRGVEE